MLKVALGILLGSSITALASSGGLSVTCGQGTLTNYIVQKDGKEICRDPGTWYKFRGEFSYIVCD